VSVWRTAQTSPAVQRKNRYVPESTAHPAKMPPAIARYAIEHYTAPGDLVLDPMCGIGTTLVEAVRTGRRAAGIEYEPHCVDIARANLHLAREHGVEHDAQVFPGGTRQLASLLPAEFVGQATLVVTSPPNGPSTHGRVAVGPAKASRSNSAFGTFGSSVRWLAVASISGVMSRPVARPPGATAWLGADTVASGERAFGEEFARIAVEQREDHRRGAASRHQAMQPGSGG